jgi:hypothetical protein
MPSRVNIQNIGTIAAANMRSLSPQQNQAPHQQLPLTPPPAQEDHWVGKLIKQGQEGAVSAVPKDRVSRTASRRIAKTKATQMPDASEVVGRRSQAGSNGASRGNGEVGRAATNGVGSIQEEEAVLEEPVLVAVAHWTPRTVGRLRVAQQSAADHVTAYTVGGAVRPHPAEFLDDNAWAKGKTPRSLVAAERAGMVTRPRGLRRPAQDVTAMLGTVLRSKEQPHLADFFEKETAKAKKAGVSSKQQRLMALLRQQEQALQETQEALRREQAKATQAWIQEVVPPTEQTVRLVLHIVDAAVDTPPADQPSSPYGLESPPSRLGAAGRRNLHEATDRVSPAKSDTEITALAAAASAADAAKQISGGEMEQLVAGGLESPPVALGESGLAREESVQRYTILSSEALEENVTRTVRRLSPGVAVAGPRAR